VERCEEHVAALYAVAYLHFGERRPAEDAVIAAVAQAAGRPALSEGVTVSVWHLLAAHIPAHSDQTASSRTLMEGVADHLVAGRQESRRPAGSLVSGGTGSKKHRAEHVRALSREDF
jgi:hypothetical protein